MLNTARGQIYLGEAGMAEWKRRLLCGEDEVSLLKCGISNNNKEDIFTEKERNSRRVKITFVIFACCEEMRVGVSSLRYVHSGCQERWKTAVLLC